LKNGGYVYRGRVEDCWVEKGRETINIKAPLSKSPNLLEAHTRTVNQVRNCYEYLTRRYGLVLYPQKELKCDIILGSQELKAVAQDVHRKYGRIRGHRVDIDKSKTGQPEFEVHTVEDAVTAVDNLAALNRLDLIDNRLYWFSVNLQKHEQVLSDISQTLKEMRDFMRSNK